ncbi:MAG: GMC family oxidoreductase [Polyangiaceae bacterium]|nr:GMC family oxidoreductase [Polyangiaceae bacterium]
MIHDASRLPLPLTLDAELCVIGSGAGGSMAAMAAAEAGLRVVVLEAGELVTPERVDQREERMIPLLLWEAGARSSEDRALRLLQGRGVGGSTLHNLNLCKRIPDELLQRWTRDLRLERLDLTTWASLYERVEAMLEVSAVPEATWNRHNRLLADGCRALGWRGGGLRHNRTGCIGSGFCELGCAYDAKNNALKVPIPRAIAAGAEVLASCRALTIEHDGGRVRGVEAEAIDPVTQEPLGRVRVRSPRVCVSGSATATPELLLRSRVPARRGLVGDSLRVHPSVVVAAEFDEPVHAWRGVPQTYECTEHLTFDGGGRRSWIVPAFAHPMAASTLVPGHGARHRELMQRYAHLAAFTAVLHDESRGRVRPRRGRGATIEYAPDAADRAELAFGIEACARLLFAAGARRVVLPGAAGRVVERGASVDDCGARAFAEGGVELSAVHPMSSVPMSDDPARGAADGRGAVRGVEGLWIADGSLFPTSIGVPPQLSIYAVGLYVGERIAEAG